MDSRKQNGRHDFETKLESSGGPKLTAKKHKHLTGEKKHKHLTGERKHKHMTGERKHKHLTRTAAVPLSR